MGSTKYILLCECFSELYPLIGFEMAGKRARSSATCQKRSVTLLQNMCEQV